MSILCVLKILLKYNISIAIESTGLDVLGDYLVNTNTFHNFVIEKLIFSGRLVHV